MVAMVKQEYYCKIKLIGGFEIEVMGVGGLITVSNVDRRGSGGSHSADEKEIGGASLVLELSGYGMNIVILSHENKYNIAYLNL